MSSTHSDVLTTAELEGLRHLAEQAARLGGSVARRYFGTDFDVRLKPDRSEVSVADEAAQRTVITFLHAARPDDAFIAEEHGDHAKLPPPTADRLCWVIDPIDGTRNFVRGAPLYACSVGAMLGGQAIAGAIYDPQRDIAFTAGGPGGVFINGQPQPPGPPDIQRPGRNPKPVVALPSSPTGVIAPLAHACLTRFVCRNLGATTLHLAYVATGRFDAMLADNPRLWDLAAGAALLTAAGARLVSPDGRERFPVDVQSYAGGELPTLAGHAERLHEILSM